MRPGINCLLKQNLSKKYNFMDFADLKNKTEKELKELLMEKRQQVRELRFKVHEKQLKNVREIKKAKAVIARILTLINNKYGKNITAKN